MDLNQGVRNMALMVLIALQFTALTNGTGDQQDKTVKNLDGGFVEVGMLYDARKDKIINNLKLWNRTIIQANTRMVPDPYTYTSFVANEDFLDRTDALDLEANVKASFLAGLIDIHGSAKYVHAEILKKNQVSVTLHYISKNHTYTLDYIPSVGYHEVCDKAKDSSGPTHVVTETTHGMQVHITLKKTVYDNKVKKTIGGALDIVCRKIPLLSLEGHAKLTMTENEQMLVQDLDVNAYGDVIFDPQPSTYENVITTYESLPEKAMNASKVVSYKLAPISNYCDQSVKIINDILNKELDRLMKMRVDFSEIEGFLKFLRDKQLSQNFPRFNQVFISIERAFNEYRSDINEMLKKFLPKIRESTADRNELTKIDRNYSNSIFYKGYLNTFLAVREREIETIENIVGIAFNGHMDSEIVLDIGRTGIGNDCIQKNHFALVYHLRVLPSEENIAEKFLAQDKPKPWDESDRWFYDPSEVGSTGQAYRDMVNFKNTNKDKELCYLITLDPQVPEKPTVELTVLENGKDLYLDFQTPGTVQEVSNREEGWNNYNLTVEFKMNPFLTHVETHVWRMDSRGESKAQKSFTKIEPGANHTKIYINNLIPNVAYNVKFYLSTDIGRGNGSDDYVIRTISISRPPDLVIKNIHANGAEMEWGTPLFIANDAKIEEYHIWLVHPEDSDRVEQQKKHLEPNEREITFKALQPATKYEAWVKAKQKKDAITVLPKNVTVQIKVESLWAKIDFFTLPARLTPPDFKGKTENTISVSWLPFQKIASEAEFLHYEISYSGSSSSAIITESVETNTTLTGLTAGHMYSIKLRTVTTKGVSDWSDVLLATTNDPEKSSIEKLKESFGISDILAMQNDTMASMMGKYDDIITKYNNIIGKYDEIISKENDINDTYAGINGIVSRYDEMEDSLQNFIGKRPFLKCYKTEDCTGLHVFFHNDVPDLRKPPYNRDKWDKAIKCCEWHGLWKLYSGYNYDLSGLEDGFRRLHDCQLGNFPDGRKVKMHPSCFNGGLGVSSLRYFGPPGGYQENSFTLVDSRVYEIEEVHIHRIEESIIVTGCSEWLASTEYDFGKGLTRCLRPHDNCREVAGLAISFYRVLSVRQGCEKERVDLDITLEPLLQQ